MDFGPEITATLAEKRRGEIMAPRANRAVFRVREGRQRPKLVEVEGVTVTAGRAAWNPIVLERDDVSALHVEFRLVEEGAVFRDLESTNGVWVRGVRVDSGFLPTGHEIQVGGFSIGLEGVQETDEPCVSRRKFGAFLGRGPDIGHMFALLTRAAETDYPILLMGETGVGKELLAKEVHERSPRKDKPFNAVNCGALPPSLIESELFGHEPGAFTGAVGRKLGIFEQARGGTVFLDEIGELPFDQQSKVLRVLDPGVVRRLGEDTSERSVDVRVIAATNRDLRGMVNAGTFREDLLYRLDVARIEVPPLRARAKGNIGLLLKAFAEEVSEELDTEVRISRPAIAMLEKHDWPGNVRELLSIVRRSALMAAVNEEQRQRTVSAEIVRRALRGRAKPVDTSLPFESYMRERQREYVMASIEECGGNKRDAAAKMGMSRSNLYRLLGLLNEE